MEVCRSKRSVRWRKGWCDLRPSADVDGRVGKDDAPICCRNSGLHRPRKGCPAPDMNTNEQTMAWIMDTYSMHARHTVTAVVTGKPIDLGGSSGRREATGRGILFVINEAVKKFGMSPESTRVVVQGSGNVGGIGAELLYEAGYKVVAISDVH